METIDTIYRYSSIDHLEYRVTKSADTLTVLFLLKRVDCNDGVSSYLETLLTGMSAKGVRSVIVSGPITSSEKTQARRQKLESASLEWISFKNFKTNIPDVKMIQAILEVISKYSVDVISPQGLSLLPLSYALSKLSRKPVVANYHPSIHGNNIETISKSRNLRERIFHSLVLKIFVPWKLIALSKDIARFFQEQCWVSSRRIEYIVAGINSEHFRPPTEGERIAARKMFQLSDDTIACVLTGRLDLNKRHDLVIAAARQLRVSNPSLKLVCFFPGSGDFAEEIRNSAIKDPADEEMFRFLGFVDELTLRNVYWASNIALLPSRLEGFGLAIAEAMACGAVPIRTPSGGAEDQIIEGQTGFIVPFNDPKALAARIGDLADPVLRRRMRHAAIAHADQHFRKEVMVTRTTDLFRRAKSASKKQIG